MSTPIRSVRLYLIIAAVIFGLIALVHVWRIAAESRVLAKEPWFMALTLLAAGLSVWAAVLAGRMGRS